MHCQNSQYYNQESNYEIHLWKDLLNIEYLSYNSRELVSDVDISEDKADIVTANFYPAENRESVGDAGEERRVEKCPGLDE